MELEVDKLVSTPASELAFVDRLRQWIFIAPPAMLFYCLIGKGGILDGKAGLYYAMQRTVAEMILSLYLLGRMVVRRDR
jgi:hypothetical protein